MSFDMRLVAYAPNGAKLGMLPHPLSFDFGMPLGDVPSLNLSYSTQSQGYEYLTTPCEIAVEYSIGGAWVEPPDGRFMRIKRSGDLNDQTGTRTFSCPGYAWQLTKLMLYPLSNPALMVEGKREFLSATPGAILMTFINEGRARGTLSGMAVDFNTTVDSAGQPWNKVMTIYYEPGTSAHSVVLNFFEQGVIDWRMNGRTLQVYNSDAALGRDLATGAAPVDLRLGRDITEAPDEGTYEESASAVFVQGEGTLQVEVTNPGAVIPWGRWEQFQSQGGITDSGTATLLAQAALDRAGEERIQITRGVSMYDAEWLPLANYQPGDHILAPGAAGTMESLRVRQITLTKDQDGVIGGNIVLNDRFLELDIRLSRKTAGILGGSTGTGGTGVEPAPDTPTGRVPAAPLGLVVNPIAYLNADGYQRGQISATWGIVNADVDGVAIDVDTYEVFIRRNLSSELWYLVSTTQSGDNNATYGDLNTGWEYGVKVRAVSEGVKGAFSSTVAVLVPNDTTPPPVPTTPVLTARLGVIHVTWPGTFAGGVGAPADFERVRVYMSSSSGGPYTAVGNIFKTGTIVIPDQPYNQTRWIRFTSMDRAQNESVPSASASVTVTPLVNTDVIGAVINGATNVIDGTIPANTKIVAGTITGALIQALAINAGHVQANAITADKIAAGTITASHIAANAITADNIAAGAITASELDADAINGKMITGSLIRTAATGQRIEIIPETLSIYFYPDGNSNYSQLWTDDNSFPGEATFNVTSGTNSIGTAKSQLVIAAGYNLMRIVRPGTGTANGGFLESAEDYARFGYSDGTSDEQSMQFDGSARTRHYGKWWDHDALGPTAGINSGSWITSSGFTGQIMTYGSTMQGNMGPVCTVRDGNTTPNFYWTLTASNQSSFTMSWGPSGSSTYTGKAIYWWSFRHNGSA